MKPHDNYIMHFNKNHDPRNGQFTKGSGGSISSTSSKKSNSRKKSDSNSSKSVDKKKAEEYIKKHPDQAKYITIGDDGRMRFDVMRWQIDEDLKQASGRLIRKKTTTTAATTTRKENTTATTKTGNEAAIRKKAVTQTGKKTISIIKGMAIAGLIGAIFGTGRGYGRRPIYDTGRLGRSLIREIPKFR